MSTCRAHRIWRDQTLRLSPKMFFTPETVRGWASQYQSSPLIGVFSLR